MELEGKRIVITGAGSGIGEALAHRFADEKPAGMALIDINEGQVSTVAANVGAVAFTSDCGDRTSLETALAAAEEAIGPIDVMCSNAGIGTHGGVELPVDAWQNIWNINLMAHVHAAGYLLPGMIERGDGYLLNTASAAGLLTQIGSAPYAVTKAAAVSLAEWLAITHGHQGIKVSCLCPQAVNTPMIADMTLGGVAGVDGVIEPQALADCVVEGMRDEEFLILPHPIVGDYIKRKADDPNRWIRGMQRLQVQFGDNS